VSKAVTPSGYARVAHSLLEHLVTGGGLEILHFGVNYRGHALDRPWPILPNRLPGDVFGRRQLPEILATFRPDVVFLCHDPEFWALHQAAVRTAPSRPRAVFYCPVEGTGMVTHHAVALADVDRLVAYTQFGAAELISVGAAPRGPVAIIPHGVDPRRFAALTGGSPRAAARSRLFPGRPELRDAFLVLNANRNCPRKRLDLTLEGFARFARGKPDVWLCLHAGLRDVGIDILAAADRLGIRERLLTRCGPDPPAVPDDELNMVFNACDVGVNTAEGEGWGLVAFEHACAGAAQVVPDHGACAELWSESGVLFPAPRPGSNLPPAPDPGGLAAALDRLYADRRFLAERSEACRAWARSPQFDWGVIAGQWRRLFTEVLGG